MSYVKCQDTNCEARFMVEKSGEVKCPAGHTNRFVYSRVIGGHVSPETAAKLESKASHEQCD